MNTNQVYIETLNLTFTYPEEFGEKTLNTNVIDDTGIAEETDESFLDIIHRIDVLPFDKIQLKYSSDFWDFTAYTTLNVEKKNLKFKFEKCERCFRNILKDYVLLKILENKMKIQSIHNFSVIPQKFLNFCANKGFIDLNSIGNKKLKEYIQFLNDNKKAKLTIIKEKML